MNPITKPSREKKVWGIKKESDHHHRSTRIEWNEKKKNSSATGRGESLNKTSNSSLESCLCCLLDDNGNDGANLVVYVNENSCPLHNSPVTRQDSKWWWMKRTAGARESEVYLMPVALSIAHEFDLFGMKRKRVASIRARGVLAICRYYGTTRIDRPNWLATSATN